MLHKPYIYIKIAAERYLGVHVVRFIYARCICMQKHRQSGTKNFRVSKKPIRKKLFTYNFLKTTYSSLCI